MFLVAQDFRYGLRQLHRNPGFTVAAVITLALGIGACTAIFSAVNPVLFQPLPYPHASRIMMVWEMRESGLQLQPCFGTFRGAEERSRTFESLAVMKPWQPAMVSDGEPHKFEGQLVSADYFRVLGVLPALGRDFQAEDDQHHGPRVVILSNRLWQRRFGGNHTTIGRTVRLDDDPFTVIGVMPASFDNVLAESAELWAPLQYDPSLPADSREWGHHLWMIGRLRPGVSPVAAKSELAGILPAWAQIHPQGYENSGGAPAGVIVTPLHEDVVRDVKPALLAILAAVALLLMIACVNVTNLLLARAAQRRGEFAVRAALGAHRARMVRQLLAESVLLATAGGALGLGVAAFGVHAIPALSPVVLPRAGAIRMDGAVFAFVALLSAAVALVVGLIPALHASSSDPHCHLQQSTRRATGGQTARRALVIAEVALSVVLLAGAGLLLRSLQRLFSVDVGFVPSHLITMQVEAASHAYDDDGARDRFFSAALEKVRGLPGVESAAFTSQLPLSGDSEVYGMQFEAYAKDQNYAAYRYAVSPDYFKTMHIPLVRGRLLDEHDHDLSPLFKSTACRPCGGRFTPSWQVGGVPVTPSAAVVISQALAQSRFRNQDPIGQRVRIGPKAGRVDLPWDVIVGVVGNIKQESLSLNQPEAFYTTTTEWSWVDSVQSLVVRTHADPVSMVPAIRNAIWSIDPDQPVVRVATMDSLVAATEARRRFVLALFEIFGFAALVLVAIGLYGVLSGSVAERTREMGVRAALGASREDILGLVIRQGMILAGVGIAVGLAGAAAATAALTSLLFGISRLDPVTYAAVMALLLAVSAIACAIPAWRAARIDPMTALRYE